MLFCRHRRHSASLWLHLAVTLCLCYGVNSFQPSSYSNNEATRISSTKLHMGAFDFLGGGSKAPKSASERNDQAIRACKAALASPRVPSCSLIECEFPPLAALNKLGDGSLRSANEVDKANVEFCAKLVRAIAPVPFLAPTVWLVTASGASQTLNGVASKAGCQVHSLRDGLPAVKGRDVCVFCSPSASRDYACAQQLVDMGVKVVIVNGFAKDPKSINEQATMAYFLKPLTYNSMVAGYLIRAYPGPWTTLDATSGNSLGTFTDSDILVSGTNTPDLRTAVRQVQKAVDERAMAARNR